MNNKRDFLLFGIIISAALWAAFVFFSPKKSDPPVDSPAVVESVPANNDAPSAPLPMNSEAGPAPAMSPSQLATPTPNFGQRLQEIGDCIKVANTLNESAQPTLSELQASLRSNLGDFTSTSMEWKTVHMTLPSGEKRRLRIEVDVDSDQALSRRAQYYSVDADGLTTPIPLSPEQEINPTDTFIAGLESDGEVTVLEEAHRGFYPGGVELYYVERNGQLSEIEINYQGKSSRCEDMEKPESHCRCF
ncbi:MAG: hypothetical protein EOP04_26380 [Proteobacteria bacterium]|nr:MAG: hypothetical protein EOP04_26380 [Pseudomonadota bacterium]